MERDGKMRKTSNYTSLDREIKKILSKNNLLELINYVSDYINYQDELGNTRPAFAIMRNIKKFFRENARAKNIALQIYKGKSTGPFVSDDELLDQMINSLFYNSELTQKFEKQLNSRERTNFMNVFLNFHKSSKQYAEFVLYGN